MWLAPPLRAEVSSRTAKVHPRRFSVVNTYTATDVGLKLAGAEPHDEVTHERARVNGASAAATSRDYTVFVQGDIRAALETIVEKVTFYRRAERAGAKHVPEFDAAVKACVIFGFNGQRITEFVLEDPCAAPILMNIRAHIDRAVKADSVEQLLRCDTSWWSLVRCPLAHKRQGQLRKC